MPPIQIRRIELQDVESFRACLDGVARERRFLAQVEAPPLERMRQFVADSVAQDAAQFVAVSQGQVVGWCDVFAHWAHALQHVGTLGVCRTWGVEAKPGPGEDSFCRARRPIADAMGQETGEKWTAGVRLQPTIPKSDRLLGMGVAAAFRGQGLGRSLIEHTLAHACAKGIYRVTLEAREDNTRAIRLYESVGFQHEGRAPCAMRFDGRFYAGVVMAKLQGPAAAA